MLRYAVVLATVCACGGPPVLSRLPQPNPAVVAGIAAAAAGAATIADPQGAARRQDEKDAAKVRDMRGIPHRESIPPDVFDRLDEAEQQGDAVGSAPATPAAAPETPASPPAD